MKMLYLIFSDASTILRCYFTPSSASLLTILNTVQYSYQCNNRVCIMFHLFYSNKNCKQHAPVASVCIYTRTLCLLFILFIEMLRFGYFYAFVLLKRQRAPGDDCLLQVLKILHCSLKSIDWNCIILYQAVSCYKLPPASPSHFSACIYLETIRHSCYLSICCVSCLFAYCHSKTHCDTSAPTIVIHAANQ